MSKEHPTPAEEPEPRQASVEMDAVGRWKRRLRPIMLVIALGFLTAAGFELYASWDGTAVRLQPVWVAFCVIPLLLGSLFQAEAWVLLIQHLTRKRVPKGAAITLYLDSQLARYTPGKVGLPLVRMIGAERLGLNARSVGGSILFEMLSWIATGSISGTVLLLLFSDMDESGLLQLARSASLAVVVSAALALVLLVCLDRRRLPRQLGGLLDITGQGPLVPWTTPLAQLAFWLTWALHGYFVVRGLSGPEPARVSSMGYFVLAPVLGFATLVAPAGVGVREAVISLGLAPWLGVAPALAAGVVSRVASLAADLCAWGLCRILGRTRGWA